MTGAAPWPALLQLMVQWGRQTQFPASSDPEGWEEGTLRSLGGQGGLPGGRGYQSLDQRSEEEFAVGGGEWVFRACSRSSMCKGPGVYETAPPFQGVHWT